MSGANLSGLNTASGFSLRHINFVPAQRPDAHSAPLAVNLIPLNDPIVSSVASAGAGGLALGPLPVCHHPETRLLDCRLAWHCSSSRLLFFNILFIRHLTGPSLTAGNAATAACWSQQSARIWISIRGGRSIRIDNRASIVLFHNCTLHCRCPLGHKLPRRTRGKAAPRSHPLVPHPSCSRSPCSG